MNSPFQDTHAVFRLIFMLISRNYNIFRLLYINQS
nr:MAG TPA: hypothetical protein [Bacteriophage sp.]